ncbi:MAG: DUF6088 family protein [Burkholderiaceae bacterium]|nr:DUF6088 family protein [Burkholderiaceae bacterium]
MSRSHFLKLSGGGKLGRSDPRCAPSACRSLRVARGTYVAPVSSRFGTRAPAPEKVVQSMAAQSGEVITPHGANAANALGLTQQVPIRGVYLTSGRSRKLKLGRYEVTVKHAPRWMLALGARLVRPCGRWSGWGRRMYASRWPPCGEHCRPRNGRR